MTTGRNARAIGLFCGLALLAASCGRDLAGDDEFAFKTPEALDAFLQGAEVTDTAGSDVATDITDAAGSSEVAGGDATDGDAADGSDADDADDATDVGAISGCVAKADGTACDDGDLCTTGSVCKGGLCASGQPKCADTACVKMTCDVKTGGCDSDSAVNNGVTCDDNNACTPSSSCAAGKCAGAANPCDDDNACTTDACDATGEGCANTNNAAACDDGNACTDSDACKDGSCAAGTALKCDDGKVCTTDSCAPDGGCKYTENSVSCDDGDPCTKLDTCGALGCVGLPLAVTVDCTDNNPCTDDACDAAKGCVHSDNNLPCDDGDVCSTGSTCGAGKCGKGKPGLWDKTVSNIGPDRLAGFIAAEDLGFFALGSRTVAGKAKEGAVIRYTPAGSPLWTKTFGDTNDDHFVRGAAADGTKLLLVGATTLPGAKATRPWLLWIDRNDGKQVSSKLIGNDGDEIYALETTGAAIRVAGTQRSGDANAWIAEVSAGGSVVWSATVAMSGDQWLTDVAARGAGWVGVGGTRDAVHDGQTPARELDSSEQVAGLFVAVDAGGKVTATRSFGGAAAQTFEYVQPTAKGALIAGNAWVRGKLGGAATGRELVVAEVDMTGATLWTRSFGAASGHQMHAGAPLASGAFAVAVSTDEDPAKSTPKLVVFDATGHLVRDRVFPGKGTATQLLALGSGRLAVGGDNVDTTDKTTDWRVIRADIFGAASCAAAGGCAGKKWGDCDDQKACTTDRCSSVNGCVHSAADTACADNNVCSLGGTCAANACVKGPARIWQHTAGSDSKKDTISAVIASPLGGAVAVGTTLSDAKNGGEDGWLYAVDGAGKKTWHLAFGGDKNDAALGVCNITKGYAAVGYRAAAGGLLQGQITAVSPTGQQLYSLELKSPNAAQTNACARLDDGLVAIGSTHSSGDDGWQATWTNVRADGTTKKSTAIGAKGSDFGNAIVADGGVQWFAGQSNRKGAGGYDGWIGTVSDEGQLLTESFHGTTGLETFNALARTTDGGVFAGGSIQKGNGQPRSGWLVKLDAAGKLQWQRKHMGNFALVRDIAATGDGGVVAVGAGDATGKGLERALVWRVSSAGATRFVRNLAGGSVEGEANAVTEVANGDLLVGGFLREAGAARNGIVWRLDPNGNATCDKGLCLPTAATVIAACDDNIACTHDSCGDSVGCQYEADNRLCEDGLECTDDLCSGKTGCSNPAVKDGSACTDSGADCRVATTCKDGKCAGGKDKLWLAEWGKNGRDQVNSLALRAAGGVLVASEEDGSSDGKSTFAVRAIAEDGTSAWTAAWPTLPGSARAVIETSNGVAMVIGHVGQSPKAAIMRLSSDGKVLSNKTYGSENCGLWSVAVGAKATVAVGLTTGAGLDGKAKLFGGDDAWVVGLDNNGAPTWDRVLGTADDDELVAVTALGDAFVAVGRRRASSKQRPWIEGLTDKGQTSWTKLGEVQQEAHLRGVASVDGGKGIIAVGFERKPNAKELTGLMLRLDTSGKQLWRRRPSFKNDSLALRDVVAVGSHLFAVGERTTANNGDESWLGRFDTDARLLSATAWGSKTDDFAAAILVSGQDVYYAGSTAVSETTGNAFVRRVDAWGNGTCQLSGKCAEKAYLDCDDGSRCTTDGCGNGACTATALSDGQECDGNDACEAGTCSSGKCGNVAKKACSDANSCTSDSCNPATGCSHKDLTDGCEGVAFAGQCFELMTGSLTWAQAETECVAWGGHLAKLDTAAKNAVVHELAKPQCPGLWRMIGLSDEKADATFAWADGSALTGKTQWYAGEPAQKKGPQGVVQNTGGEWQTLDWTANEMCFVCSRKLAQPCGDSTDCQAAKLCAAGTCVAPKGTVCDDHNSCTVDSCGAGTACGHKEIAAGSACDDGRPCRGAGRCEAGSCRAPMVNNCDDGVPCTTDLCVAGKGCQSVPVADKCDGAVVNGVCYKLVTGRFTHELGHNACAAWGGTLPIIRNSSDNTAVRAAGDTKCKGSDILLGATDLRREGVFEWPDATKLTYGNWGANEPSNHNGTEHGTMMAAGGDWNDVNLETAIAECGVVCQRPAVTLCTQSCADGTCKAGVCATTDAKLFSVAAGDKADDMLRAVSRLADGTYVAGGVWDVDVKDGKRTSTVFAHSSSGLDWEWQQKGGEVRALAAIGAHVVAVGYSSDSGFAVRLDSAGDEKWIVKLGTAGDEINGIAKSESGLFVAGSTVNSGLALVKDHRRRGWLALVTPDGKVVGDRVLTMGAELAFAGATRAENGLISVGRTRATAGAKSDGVVVLSDAGGKEVWRAKLGSALDDELSSAAWLDGRAIAVGVTTSSSHGQQGWAVSLDEAGNVLWDRSWGDKSADRLSSVARLNGSTVLAAGASSNGASLSGWLLRIDAAGQVVGANKPSLGADSGIAAVRALADGTMLLAGTTRDKVASSWDGWIARLDAFGTSDCTKSGGCSDKAWDACFDNEPCTADSCQGGSCVHAAQNDATTCTDGGPCAVGACKQGKCSDSKPVKCDDGKACTASKCDPKFGCQHATIDQPCEGLAKNGRCLQAFDGLFDVQKAAKTCQEWGGQLAKVGSSTEQLYANQERARVCGAAETWIGLSDVESENTWRWPDGTVLGSHKPWAKDEPNNAGGAEHFVVMDAAGDWNDKSGTSQIACALCQRSLGAAQCSKETGCFQAGVCTAGVCPAVTANACNDGQGCTLDACNGNGCVHSVATNGAACNDGEPCTGAGECDGKKPLCRWGSLTVCDDGTPCSSDVCAWGKGCAFTPESSGCDGTTYNGKCYQIVAEKRSWSSHQRVCAQWGGNLLSIGNATERAQIDLMLKSKCTGKVAVGAAKFDGAFRWLDGTASQELPWAKGEPNDAGDGEGNVAYEAGKGLADIDWRTSLACGVCEKPLETPCVTDACLAGTCSDGSCHKGAAPALHSATLGGDGNDLGYGIVALPNGSVVIAGQTQSKSLGVVSAGDAWVERLNAVGKTEWVQRHDGKPGLYDSWNDAAVLDNGELVICGYLDDDAKRPAQVRWLDPATGKTLRTHDYVGYSYPRSARGCVANGDQVLATGTQSTSHANGPRTVSWFGQYNAAGKVMKELNWTLGGHHIRMNDVSWRVNKDDQFIVIGAGSTQNLGKNETIQVTYIDWAKNLIVALYGLPDTYESRAEAITPSGENHVIAGFSKVSGSTSREATLWQLSGKGAIVWQKRYAKTGYSLLSALAERDGSIVAVGAGVGVGGPQYSPLWMRVSSKGELLSSKVINVGKTAHFANMVAAPAGGFWAVGSTLDNAGKNTDFVLSRLDRWGNTTCVDSGTCIVAPLSTCKAGSACEADSCTN